MYKEFMGLTLDEDYNVITKEEVKNIYDIIRELHLDVIDGNVPITKPIALLPFIHYQHSTGTFTPESTSAPLNILNDDSNGNIIETIAYMRDAITMQTSTLDFPKGIDIFNKLNSFVEEEDELSFAVFDLHANSYSGLVTLADTIVDFEGNKLPILIDPELLRAPEKEIKYLISIGLPLIMFKGTRQSYARFSEKLVKTVKGKLARKLGIMLFPQIFELSQFITVDLSSKDKLRILNKENASKEVLTEILRNYFAERAIDKNEISREEIESYYRNLKEERANTAYEEAESKMKNAFKALEEMNYKIAFNQDESKKEELMLERMKRGEEYRYAKEEFELLSKTR